MPRLRCLAVICALLFAGTAGAQQTVTVFAASSLKSALDDLVHGYLGPEAITVSYGGSSALARQIQFGAPAQIFISANPEWMDVLEGDGLLAPGTRFALLTNALVLIAAPDTDMMFDFEHDDDLATVLNGGWLAMALVDAVPAGIYGRAALQSLGLWSGVAEQVLQVDNVRAALRLVSLGEATMGVVYATDAAADPAVRLLATFPPGSHPAIVYPIAMMADGQNGAAQAVFAYLLGPDAGTVFAAHGFGLPDARK